MTNPLHWQASTAPSRPAIDSLPPDVHIWYSCYFGTSFHDPPPGDTPMALSALCYDVALRDQDIGSQGSGHVQWELLFLQVHLEPWAVDI